MGQQDICWLLSLPTNLFFLLLFLFSKYPFEEQEGGFGVRNRSFIGIRLLHSYFSVTVREIFDRNRNLSSLTTSYYSSIAIDAI